MEYQDSRPVKLKTLGEVESQRALPKLPEVHSQKPTFARLKCNRARTAFQEEHKANKRYRQSYRQLALRVLTISNLQHREAPLSTCNHC